MAVTTTVVIGAGYPQSVGEKQECLAGVYLTGTYAAGGFMVEARQFGLQFIEFISCSMQAATGLRSGIWNTTVTLPAVDHQ
jgi:hypothetical protein